jgi:hypothetical protein
MDRLQVPGIGKQQQPQKIIFNKLIEVKIKYTNTLLEPIVYLTDIYILEVEGISPKYVDDLKVAVDLNTGELHVLSEFSSGKDLKMETLHMSSIIQWTYGRDEGKENVNSLSFLVKC